MAPYQGSTLDQLGTLSGPQTPRLLTLPLTTNPGSAPDDILNNLYILPIKQKNQLKRLWSFISEYFKS